MRNKLTYKSVNGPIEKLIISNGTDVYRLSMIDKHQFKAVDNLVYWFVEMVSPPINSAPTRPCPTCHRKTYVTL